MTTIYIVRAIIPDPDRHDLADAYDEVPGNAFSTLEKAIAAVQRWAAGDVAGLLEGEEDSTVDEQSKAAQVEIDGLLAKAREFFEKVHAEKAEKPNTYVNSTFSFESEYAGYTYLVGEAVLDPED
jgi:hypothetical protein